MTNAAPPSEKPKLALRLDDPGAASKRNEVYSDWRWRWGSLRLDGNWLFLKYLAPFRKWGIYPELTAAEWHEVFDLLTAHRASLTVAVTASWVEGDGTLTPFPQKFPAAAAALKEGQQQGLIEIANHGLTHCVLADGVFRPRWFSGNRRFHREFWDWVPPEIHAEHLRQAQNILQAYFATEVVTFVPPGNVFTAATVTSAVRQGLRYLSCATEACEQDGMRILGNVDTLAFHDREIVLEGVGWLDKLLTRHAGYNFCTVKELAEAAREDPHRD